MDRLVFGLDAADWRIVDPLLEADRLPNLASLVEDGATADLDSTRPAMTPLAWTSIATGVNPGKHSIYDFREQDRDTYRVSPVEFSDVDRELLWDGFESQGESVGVVNFPLAHPPSETPAFFVSGIPVAPGATIAHPPNLQSTIEASDYRVHPDTDPGDGLEAYYEELVALTDTQASLAADCFQRHDPDLGVIVFMGIDWIQHYFWDDHLDGERAVHRLYERMDAVLGDLLDATDPTDVVVLSDHGATDLEGELHLNSLLEREGFLERVAETPSLRERAIDDALAVAWSFGSRLPDNVKRLALEIAPDAMLDDMQTAAEFGQADLHTKVDWERTTAFSYGSMGRVFIHTEADYPDGTVSDDEYETVRTDIVDLLEGLHDPESGEHIVENVHFCEDLYNGPHLDDAPDVVFSTRDAKYMCYGDFGEDWFHDPRHRVADHAPQGLFIAAGEHFRDVEVDASLVDIVPTLAHLHGLPILADIDGSVLTAAFEETFRDAHEVTMTETYGPPTGDADAGADDEDDSPDEDVESRLEDLGYL